MPSDHQGDERSGQGAGAVCQVCGALRIAAMVIRGDDNWLEINVADRIPADLPTPEDFSISISVSSHGFAGRGSSWIAVEAMTQFIDELRELEKQRHGSATLEGMSPGSFQLRFWSINRRGHMAVAGRISKEIMQNEAAPYQPFHHSVEFAFELDPTDLPRVLAEFVRIAGQNSGILGAKK
jgi:hypothetical protein